MGKIRSLAILAAFTCLAGMPHRLSAQAIPGTTQPPYSRFDLYGGYGWFHPLNSGIAGKQYQDITNPNATASASFYFNRFVGVQMEGSYFSGDGEHRMYDAACAKTMCDQLIYTAEAGPVLRLPLGRFVPFVHALGGGERTNGPVDQSLMWGWGVTGGVGVDYILPFFHNHLAVRPIQADYQYSQVVYGPLHLPAAAVGGFGEISALKLSGGLVFRMGDIREKPPLAIGCIADPMTVYAGEPVVVHGETTGLDPKRRADWKWEANGGALHPSGAAVTIDTTGLAAGEYTAAGHLSQGPRTTQQASCEVPFTVHTHAVEAPVEAPVAASPVVSSIPTLSCSANPASATAGNSIDITAVGTSPSNRPLTYSYSATGGTIVGNGPSARLSTAGLGDGLITVTCNVTDDQAQHASATATVSISSAAVPVIPNTQPLCTIGFMRDKRRPARVDNEAKACLDDIALTLSQGSDSHLVMIGNTSDEEAATVAAERVMNARQYLTDAKGIDASRIELRVGATTGRTVDNVLVPSGATYDNSNTQTFDESSITRHGEAYGVHHGSAAPILGTATHHAAAHHATAHHTAVTHHTVVHRSSSTTFTGTSNPPDLHIAPVPTPTRQDPANPGTPVTSIPPLK